MRSTVVFWLICLVAFVSCISNNIQLGNDSTSDVEKTTPSSSWRSFFEREKNRVDYKAFLECQPSLFDQLFPGSDKLETIRLPEGLSDNQKEFIIKYYFDKIQKEDSSEILPRREPDRKGYEEGLKRLRTFIDRFQSSADSRESRTLVVYHIGPVDYTLSADVSRNNVVIFSHAVSLDQLQINETQNSSTFYWINIVKGRSNGGEGGMTTRENPLGRIVKDRLSQQRNVAIAEWAKATSDIYLHFRTISLLRDVFENNQTSRSTLFDVFGSFLLFSHGVRGPTAPLSKLSAKGGHWLDLLRNPLFENKGESTRNKAVGMVGITANCDPSNDQVPHLQSYVLTMAAEIVSPLLDQFFGRDSPGYPHNSLVLTKLTSYTDVVRHYELGFSRFVVDVLNMDIVSLHSRESWKKESFQNSFVNESFNKVFPNTSIWVKDGLCLPFAESYFDHYSSPNPQSWCSLSEALDRIPLHKWGGGAFRYFGVLCPLVKMDMQTWLVDFWRQNAVEAADDNDEVTEHKAWLRKSLIAPESYFPDYDFRHDLNRDFHLDILKQHMLNNKQGSASVDKNAEHAPNRGKVCYLVEISKRHFYLDPVGDENVLDQDVFPPLDRLVGALHRQTAIREWTSFFYTLDDDASFNDEVHAALDSYSSTQMYFLLIHQLFSPPLFPLPPSLSPSGRQDVLRAARLKILTAIAEGVPDCTWLTLMPVNTGIGSDITNNVLSYSDPSTDRHYDLLFAPIDSLTLSGLDEEISSTQVQGDDSSGGVALPVACCDRLIDRYVDSVFATTVYPSVVDSRVIRSDSIAERTGAHSNSSEEKTVYESINTVNLTYTSLPHMSRAMRLLERLREMESEREKNKEKGFHHRIEDEDDRSLLGVFYRSSSVARFMNSMQDGSVSYMEFETGSNDDPKDSKVPLGNFVWLTPSRLVRDDLWTFTKLPMQSLSSLLYEMPSALWCFAAGMTFHDSNVPTLRHCYSAKMVLDIFNVDMTLMFGREAIKQWVDIDRIIKMFGETAGVLYDWKIVWENRYSCLKAKSNVVHDPQFANRRRKFPIPLRD